MSLCLMPFRLMSLCMGSPRLLLLPALVLTLGLPAHAQTPPPTTSPPCESTTPRNERREVACTLGTDWASRPLRFEARFSGSHDDTTLSLAATLDGRPLACGPGSKTASEYEDGDISLSCRFTLPDSSAKPPVLRVLLSWYHAQYTDFTLVAE